MSVHLDVKVSSVCARVEVYTLIGHALANANDLRSPTIMVKMVNERPCEINQVPLVHVLVLLASFCVLWSAYNVDRAEVVVKDVCSGHVVQ